ncbi:acyltransferase domain-containing protein [Streptomyces longwoodensis]|uniref:acyltransferase domain-containing protein n=1 Tax=Streptomyces longwoodensis TaxID=68231 RepID=UPI0033CD2370
MADWTPHFSRNESRPGEERLELAYAFPGQGDFSVSALLKGTRRHRAVHDAVADTFTVTDQIAVEEGLPPIGRALLGADPPNGRDLAQAPVGTAQLVQFAVSVGLYRALSAVLGPPDRLIAVSFGEIPALVAADALALRDGARITCQLAQHMSAHPGAMLLVHAGEPDTTELLAARPDNRVALACVNAPYECVVSGPTAAIAELERLAAERRIAVNRLRLDTLAHHPDLADAADTFCSYVQHIPAQMPAVPVHSAVNGLYTSPGQLAQGLANCLIRPVRLPPTLLDALAPPGIVLEIGTGEALTRNVLQTLPEGQVAAYNPLRAASFTWDPPPGTDSSQTFRVHAAESEAP